MTIEVKKSARTSGIGSEFFAEVKNGRDETTEVPGGYGSYPHIYSVRIGDAEFFGFATGLPEEREPWHAGFLPFNRNTVLDAETLEEVDSETAEMVNTLIDKLTDDVGEKDESFAEALALFNSVEASAAACCTVTDGGSEADDSSDDEDDGLGELFG